MAQLEVTRNSWTQSEQGSMKSSSKALALCRRTLRCFMDIDSEKLEQAVLALFQMTLSDDSRRRAWKSLPWSVLDVLHQKGYIPIQPRRTRLYG
jgi:hypothetical protein